MDFGTAAAGAWKTRCLVLDKCSHLVKTWVGQKPVSLHHRTVRNASVCSMSVTRQLHRIRQGPRLGSTRIGRCVYGPFKERLVNISLFGDRVHVRARRLAFAPEGTDGERK